MLPESWLLLWHSGLEFNVKIMEAWIHPCIHSSGCCCLCAGHAHFYPLSTDWVSFKLHGLPAYILWLLPSLNGHSVHIFWCTQTTQTPSTVQQSTFRMLYWKPSQRNVTSTLLNLCRVELLQFRRQKEVQFGTSKVSWTDTRWIIVTDSGCF